MKKETIEICQQCCWFDNGKCIMHHIEVCYNDEVCKDFIEEKKRNRRMKTKIQIKTLWGSLLYEHEAEDNSLRKTVEEAVKSGAYLGDANLRGAYLGDANLGGAYLGGANLRGANLCGAYLCGANLRGAYLGGAYLGDANLRGAYLGDANLCGAYLCGANLRGANLGGAYLGGAYLGDANLCGAYLCGAYLRGANLGGAYLGGANLRGANLGGANLGEDWGELSSASDVLVVGTIGSREGYTTVFHTDKGIFVLCGCFRGTLDEFAAKVKETHAGTKHERDYNALINFVKIKFSGYDVQIG